MPPYENRPGWGKTGERMSLTFTDRCNIAAGCLPKAGYREMLEKLHAEMLAALAQTARKPLTDWQIMGALNLKSCEGYRAIVRAVEAAHGITAAKDKP